MLGFARYPVLFVMTLAELRDMLDVSISRDDLAGHYTSWINRGLRAVQRDHSYNCMRHVSTVTMASGTASARLPDDFKELQPQRGSVSLYEAVTGYFPCEVTSRETLIFAATTPRAEPANRVFLSISDGTSSFLNFLENTSNDVTFSVAYFRYLPKLVADTDENYFTREFEDLVQARIKAVAFSVINDPQAGAELGLYGVAKREAIAFDAKQRIQGRVVAMGIGG